MNYFNVCLVGLTLLCSSCSQSNEITNEEIDREMRQAIKSEITYISSEVPIYFEINSTDRNRIANAIYRSTSDKLLGFSTYEKHLIKDTIPDILLTGQLNNLCVAMAFYVKYNQHYKQFNNLNDSILETHNWIIKSHQEYLKIIDKKFASTKLEYDCRNFE